MVGVREKDTMDGEPTWIEVGRRKQGRGRATCVRGQQKIQEGPVAEKRKAEKMRKM